MMTMTNRLHHYYTHKTTLHDKMVSISLKTNHASTASGGGSNKLALLQKQMLLAAVILLCVIVGSSMNRDPSSTRNSNPHSLKGKGIKLQSVDEQLKDKKQPDNNNNNKQPNNKKKLTQTAKVNSHGFHLCRLKPDLTGLSEKPVLDGVPLQLPYEFSPLPIRYQCAGPAYEQHGGQLEQLLKHHQSKLQKQFDPTHSQEGTWWGQRPHPIPLSDDGESNQRTNLLVIGSTHLRQVLTALVCQYADHVDSVQRIHGTSQFSLSSFTLRIRFHNNIDLYLCINPPFLYSPHWPTLLERHVTQLPLRQMDLIVVGRLHQYSPPKGQALLDFLQDHEGSHELAVLAKTKSKTKTVKRGNDNDDGGDNHEEDDDDEEDPPLVAYEPPTFHDFVEAYSGPIVYVSHFAAYGNSTLFHIQQTIQALKNGQEPPKPDPRTTQRQHKPHIIPSSLTRQQVGGDISKAAADMFTTKATPPKVNHNHAHHRRQLQDQTRERRNNLRAIDARRYTSQLGECATDEGFQTVGTCLTDNTNRWYQNGHRCFGAQGGHADLVAWDLIEAFYKLLKKHRKSS